jgi:hypothetical protein
MKEEIIFICDCHSFEHQIIFWEDEDNELHLMIHLSKKHSFFKRIIVAIKYIFGYTSIYGEWDSFIFQEKDKKKLFEYLKK